jgi:sec-independent protein translocase protein TatA
MGSMSLVHWIIVGAVLLLLFGGKGKISDVMGDVAKGIKSFKKGLSEDDESKIAATHPAEPARTLDHQPQVQAQPYAAPSTQPVAHETEPRKVG